MLIHNQSLAIAGNVVTTILVPAGRNYHILYANTVLTTNSTVANRRVQMIIYDAANVAVFNTHSGVVVAASKTNQIHSFQEGIYRETSFIGNLTQISIPSDFIILPGYSIKISIDNGVSGDAYSCDFFISDMDKSGEPYK